MKKRGRTVSLWYSVFDDTAICFNRNANDHVYYFVFYSNWYLISNLVRSDISSHVKTCVAQYLFNPIYYCVDMSVGDCSYAFIWDNLKRR